jgi:hypothetical protein
MRIIVSLPEPEGVSRGDYADIMKKDGWVPVSVGLEDPTFSHPDVKSQEEARARLRRIGVDPSDTIIDLDPDDA